MNRNVVFLFIFPFGNRGKFSLCLQSVCSVSVIPANVLKRGMIYSRSRQWMTISESLECGCGISA